MAKLTLNEIQGQYASTTELNANFSLIETAVEKTLSRDGTTPNTMSDALDMNTNTINNLGAPQNSTSAARLQDVTGTGTVEIGRTVYTSVADLRLSDPTLEQNVLTSGVTSEGDGGHGEWYWDSTSTETDNTGTIVKVTTVTTGRWIRLYSGAVNTRWFGSVIDGSTDDYATNQAAIDAVETLSGSVFSPAGISMISDSLIIPGGVSLFGEGFESSVIKITSGFATNKPAIKNKNINVTAYTYDDVGIVIEKLQINGNGNTGRLTGLIDLVKTKDTTIQLCKITGSDYFGITDAGNLNLSVFNNVLTSLGKTTGVSPAIWSQSYTVDGTLSRGTKVTYNRIQDNNRTGVQAASVDMVVAYNYFKNNGESTIFMNTNAAYCKIVNNKIETANRTDISAHGIEAAGSGHVITGNQIRDVDGSGITLTDVSDTIVSDNSIENYRADSAYYTVTWAAAGISVINTPAGITNNITISNNIIRKGSNGVNAIVIYHQPSSTACTKIYIQNNDLIDGGSGDEIHYQTGITTKLGESCRVKDNSGHASKSGIIGSFQAGASTGDYTITGLPFPPHKIIFDAVNTATNEVRKSKGIAYRDSTAQAQYISFNTNTDVNVASVTGSNTVVRITNSAGTDLFRATITSYEGSDGLGFTINKSVAAINPVISYEALP